MSPPEEPSARQSAVPEELQQESLGPSQPIPIPNASASGSSPDWGIKSGSSFGRSQEEHARDPQRGHKQTMDAHIELMNEHEALKRSLHRAADENAALSAENMDLKQQVAELEQQMQMFAYPPHDPYSSLARAQNGEMSAEDPLRAKMYGQLKKAFISTTRDIASDQVARYVVPMMMHYAQADYKELVESAEREAQMLQSRKRKRDLESEVRNPAQVQKRRATTQESELRRLLRETDSRSKRGGAQ